MKRSTSLLALLLGSALMFGLNSSASAACSGKDKLIFSCAMKSGKHVEVCDAGSNIEYSFGKPGKPEMALAVPRKRTSTYQWQGIGRSMPYSINIPNGNTEYRVFTVADKMMEGDNGGYEAGINVVSNGKQVAALKCLPKTVKSNLEGLDLPRSEEW